QGNPEDECRLNPDAHQKAGSSLAPLPHPPPVLLAHGSSAGAFQEFAAGADGWVFPLRSVRVTFAEAQRSDGPISCTSSSITVRFSPSFVSKERDLRLP